MFATKLMRLVLFITVVGRSAVLDINDAEAKNPTIMPAHEEFTHPVREIIVAHSGKFAMIAEWDGNIWKWVFDKNCIEYGPAPADRVSRMLLSSDDQLLIYGGHSPIFMWDVKRRWRYQATEGIHEPLAFFDDDTIIGFQFIEDRAEFVFWEVRDHSLGTTLAQPTGAAAWLSEVSADKKWVVGIPTAVPFDENKSRPRIWKIDYEDHRPMFEEESQALAGARSIAFAPRGDLFAAAWGNERDVGGQAIDSPVYPKGRAVEVKLFSTKIWKEQEIIRVCNEGRAMDLAFSSDGAYLAVAVYCTDAKERGMGKVRSFIDIYDVDTRERITTITPESDCVKASDAFNCVSFLLNGRRLICSWKGSEVQLWDLSQRLKEDNAKR